MFQNVKVFPAHIEVEVHIPPSKEAHLPGQTSELSTPDPDLTQISRTESPTKISLNDTPIPNYDDWSDLSSNASSVGNFSGGERQIAIAMTDQQMTVQPVGAVPPIEQKGKRQLTHRNIANKLI